MYEVVTIVKPSTLLTWHRKFVARKFDSSKVTRKPGRPRKPDGLEQLVLIFARENKVWGYPRITGALKNLGFDICPEDAKYLIHDRDTKYTAQFDAIMKGSGVKPLKTPFKSPNLNSYSERFVRTVKETCLDSMILFGEKSLRRVMKNFIAHYHEERNHQGLNNTIPFPAEHVGKTTGEIKTKERLGGLLKYYYREAA